MTAEARRYVVTLALKLVGCPYIWGGSSPMTGMDCSGFVVWLYQVFGALPSGDWSSGMLAERWMHTAEPEPGDLAFYGKSGRVSHVMMHIGGGNVVGASGGDSTTTTLEEARRRGAMVKVRETRYRSDYLFSCGVGLDKATPV